MGARPFPARVAVLSGEVWPRAGRTQAPHAHGGLATPSQPLSVGVFWASSSIKTHSPSPTAQQEGRETLWTRLLWSKQPGASKFRVFHMEKHKCTTVVIFFISS